VLERIVTQGNNDRVAIVPFYEALECIIEKKSGKKALSWLNLFDHWKIVAIIQNIVSRFIHIADGIFIEHVWKRGNVGWFVFE
jgi:hypothetical protein